MADFRIRRVSIRGLAIVLGAVGLAFAGNQATAQQSSGEPIKLGVLTALSGPYVPYGQPLYDGVKMAVDEVNAAGGLEIDGVRHPVQIVERDTRSDVNTAVVGATALVRDDEVKFVVGPATGIETSAAQEITQRAKVIELSAASVLQGILNKENTAPGGDKRYLFMVQTGSDVREDLTIKAAMKYFDKPQKQALIISNDSNGDFIGQRVVQAVEANGAEMALPKVLYEPGTTDYSPYLTKIRDADPDHLNIWWLPTDGMNILQQARQLDVADSYFIFGPEPLDLAKRVPGADKVLIACSPICRGITTTPATAAFWERYGALLGADSKFGAAAGGAAWYYEGTRMLFEAIRKAGTAEDTDAIAATLADAEVDGALGTMRFDERHVAIHGFDFCLFQNGKPSCEYLTQ